MLLLTWKSRALIDSAVQQWANETQRQIWQSWRAQNLKMRLPDAVNQERETLPAEVALVILPALEHMAALQRNQLDLPDLSEDEVSDLENDLTYIYRLSRDLNQIPEY